MEENDNMIDKHFRKVFQSFEPEPPQEAWEAIRKQLPPESLEPGARFSCRSVFSWFAPGYRLYPAIIIIAFLLIGIFLLLYPKQPASLQGTALIEGEKLCRGTAYLFHVNDHNTPLDSVRFHSKNNLDSNGRFHFKDIPSGKYLLRIQVDPGSLYFPQYRHSYYGNQLHWDKACLIDTDNPEKEYTIHIPRFTH